MVVMIPMPSIVDPTSFLGGAGTYARGLIDVLRREPLCAEVETVTPSGFLRRQHRLQQVASLLRSVGSPLPSKALFQYSRSFRGTVARRLEAMRPDLIVLNGADLLWLLAEIPDELPTILVALNVEHELFRAQIDSLRGIPKPIRRLLLRDCRKLREYELAGAESVRSVVLASPMDAAALRREPGSRNVLTLPPIFPYPPYERKGRRKSGVGLEIGLMAHFGWWPNQSGFRWFLRHVLPKTKPDLRVHLYGAGSETAARSAPRLVGHGFVKELRQVWERCDFMICPTVTGSGVNVKLAETIYNSMPVLATPLAARGLPITSGEGIALFERAEQWVDFLNGPSAEAFRLQRVPRSVGDNFRAESHADSVQAFVVDACAG